MFRLKRTYVYTMNLNFLMFIEVSTILSHKQSVHERLWGSFTLYAIPCSLHFDKHMTNKIHSLMGTAACLTVPFLQGGEPAS